jgi:hypothetical protein
MKTHLRDRKRGTHLGTTFTFCGFHSSITIPIALTRDPYKVDCKRCLAVMAAERRRDAKRTANVTKQTSSRER